MAAGGAARRLRVLCQEANLAAQAAGDRVLRVRELQPHAEGAAGRVDDAVDHREDQVLVLDLGRVEQDLAGMLQCIGKGYEPPSRVLVV